MRTQYSKKLTDYASRHSSEYTVNEWIKIMQDRFDVHFNQKQMRHFFYMRGLPIKSIQTTNRKSFNKKMYDYLMNNAENYTIRELTEIVNKKFNENFKLKQLQQFCWRHKIPFKYEMKKKSNNGVGLPIGTERIKADGMHQIKVAPHKWVYKQRYIYEKYHNVELKKDEYVIFLDQNRDNFDINNLQVVTSAESGFMASLGVFSSDKRITELGLDVVRLKMKTKEIKENE